MTRNRQKTRTLPAAQAVDPVLPHLVTPESYPETSNPVDLAVASQNTRDSRRTMVVNLGRLAAIASGAQLTAREFPWPRLRYRDTARLRRELATLYEPATANTKLAALRSVHLQAWRLELMDREAYERAADERNIPGTSDLAGRRLDAAEMRQLARACEKDPSARGARDGAMIALMGRAGLRCTEVVRIDLAHADLKAAELRVRGKGARRRTVALAPGVLRALDAWLEYRGRRQGPLFWRLDRYGGLRPARLSRETVSRACRERARDAGIERTTPHDLRRTFTTSLLEAGVDLFVAGALLGHAKIDTTRRYDHRDDAPRRRALEALDAALGG